MRGRHASRALRGELAELDAMLDRHDYEPGDTRHPMHTDPACRVCGRPARDGSHR
jgi:hypothetical protein